MCRVVVDVVLAAAAFELKNILVGVAAGASTSLLFSAVVVAARLSSSEPREEEGTARLLQTVPSVGIGKTKVLLPLPAEPSRGGRRGDGTSPWSRSQ